MSTRRTVIGIAAIGAIVIAGIYGSLHLHAQGQTQKVQFLLDWKAGMEYVGFYVAKEKGFYRDVGLDVDIQEGSGATTVAKLVAQRKPDVGLVTGDAVILAVREGLPIKAVSVLLQRSPVVIFSLERANIRKLDDLRGKTIGVSTGDTKYNYFKGIANRLKLVGAVNEVNVGFDVTPLLTNKVDALLGYVNVQPVQVELEGQKVNVISLADNGLDLYGESIVVNEAALKENPERYKRFVSASLKGWQYAFDHPDETVAIFIRLFPEQKREFLVKSLEKVTPLFKSKDVPLGGQTVEGWSKAIKIMREFGLLDKDINPRDLFVQGIGVQ